LVRGEKGGKKVTHLGPVALLSVYEKRGIVDFARGLCSLGFKLISTSGTLRVLQKEGVPVTSIEKITGFPEIFSGRIKTLHPKILGGILMRRDNKKDREEAKKHGMPLIDLVVVNLYPFEEKSKMNLEERKLLEEIDIGGVTLLRAAVKNYKDVLVVTDPDDYESVLDRLSQKRVSLEFRRKLALKAIKKTALYDSFISNTFEKNWFSEDFPETLFMAFSDPFSLRYGENPHQKGIFYPGEGAKIQSIWGKPLSYNNLLDIEGALELIFELGDEKPAAVIVKHTSPCGAAIRDTIEEAYRGAWESDSLSAFGGILALNRSPSPELAKALNKVFLEVIIAPHFPDEALEILKKKKNRRLIPLGSFAGLKELLQPEYKFRSLFKGVLLQSPDRKILSQPLFDVDQNPLSEDETKEAVFATKVVKHTKSNAIVISKGLATVGIGSGLPSRVEAVKLALSKAGERALGATLASDAFFPFPDSIKIAARGGIKLIVQPGGSVRDEEVIRKARELGIKMVLTGLRHFKH